MNEQTFETNPNPGLPHFFFRVLVVCVRQAFKRVCELTESSKAQRRRKGNDDGAATKRMMQEEKEKEQKQQEEKKRVAR
jgi:hypothetical protein